MLAHGATALAALLAVDGGPTTPTIPPNGELLTLIVGSITSITIAAIGAAAVWKRRRRGEDLDDVNAYTKAVTVEVNFVRFRRRTNRRLASLERRMGALETGPGELQAGHHRPKGSRRGRPPD